MRREKKYYIICWILLVGLFNVIAFVTPETIGGQQKLNDTFWSVYGIMMGAFIAHFVYSCFVLKEEDKFARKRNTPIFIVSIIESAILGIVGTILMLVPGTKSWVGIIVCSILLALSVVFLILMQIVGDRHDKR